MWRMLSIMRRNLHDMRKSSRVADEAAMSSANDAQTTFMQDGGDTGLRRRWRPGVSVLYGVLIRAPVSILSACFVHPRVGNGADGGWASVDFARPSEMNQLVVSDSIRYALLM